jgi:hypothetical protein
MKRPMRETLIRGRLAALLVGSALAAGVPALAAPPETGFTPLYNGRDLSGWVNVNCAPSTFTARDGMIVITGVPTGVLRTDRMYENFILELEWRHLKAGGNSGVFVWSDPVTAPGTPYARAIEVQVLDGVESENYTSQGDLFAIHGAVMKPDRPHPAGWMRCLPSERRSKPSPEWNHYRVIARDGTLKLEVNGKEVSGGSECRPRKGYICLESEGSECHFRGLRIKELPSSGAKPEETAEEAQGFRPLYTGLDLAGWRASETVRKEWKPRDWVLECGGPSILLSEGEYRDFVLVCDWRSEGAAKAPAGPLLQLRGSEKGRIPLGSVGAESGGKPGEWNRSVVTLRGDRLTLVLNGKTLVAEKRLEALPERGPLGLQGGGGKVEFANLLLRETAR